MSSTSDTGTLKRGVLLLKLLATAGPRGLPLTEIAARANLPHPSAHRVLQQLGAERLVDRHPELRRYRLGPLAFELGIAGSTMYDIRDLCEPSMQTLARATGDTIYLIVRSGFDAVCMHRHEGSFPIRALVLEVGSRRPLGVGAGGLAILSALAPARAEEILQVNAVRYPAYGGIDVAWLRAAIQQTQRDGYATISEKATPGMTAIGVPILGPAGEPIGAISIAAISQRMAVKRRVELARLLRAQCETVTAAMSRDR